LLPEAALAAILLSAAIDLFDLHGFRRLAQIDRSELYFALVAAAGVVWVGVLQGVFVAVLLTLAHLILKVSGPNTASWAGTPSVTRWSRSAAIPDARLSPQITVFLFEGPLMFLNAGTSASGCSPCWRTIRTRAGWCSTPRACTTPTPARWTRSKRSRPRSTYAA
jgi:MFS superfamily sulfate permease-like transporter